MRFPNSIKSRAPTCVGISPADILPALPGLPATFLGGWKTRPLPGQRFRPESNGTSDCIDRSPSHTATAAAR